MPVFNWVALKPNQINGTVFNEIDDERILEVSGYLKGLAPDAPCRAGLLLLFCCDTNTNAMVGFPLGPERG